MLYLLRCGAVNLSVCQGVFARILSIFLVKTEPFRCHLHDLHELQCFLIVHTARFPANPFY